jgi:hypothetical protein
VNINKTTVLRKVRAFPHTFRTSKKVRWGVAIFVAFGIFGAGQSATGPKVPDPRQMVGPGGVTSIGQLYGEWDGVGTLPDGTPFCLKGWPCEDVGFKADK